MNDDKPKNIEAATTPIEWLALAPIIFVLVMLCFIGAILLGGKAI